MSRIGRVPIPVPSGLGTVSIEYKRYGVGLARFLRERVEVVDGDVSQPDLGLAPEVAEVLRKNLDLIINSSGLTDFNPDLRDALLTNVDAVVGKMGVVTKRIGQRDCGIVKVGSEEWRAELAQPNDSAREVGADVEIVSVEGVTLKVK